MICTHLKGKKKHMSANQTFLLKKFHKEWFQYSEWWFQKEDQSYVDKYLSDTYYDLLDTATLLIPPVLNDHISLLIVYDQLPRHIFRNQPCNHVIYYFLSKALDIFNFLVNNDYLQYIHGEELCFVLLSLRHSNIPENIYIALDIVWDRIRDEDPKYIKIYQRFLKATYERCSIICGHLQQPTHFPSSSLHLNTSILEYYGHLQLYCEEDIGVIKTFAREIKKYQKEVPKIIISLSGGVDSMVCSYIAANMLGVDRCIFLHINYNNRDTSDEEETFVRYWCNLLGVPLYLRKFTEINRPLCMKYEMREMYETYTRNVRYACYRDVGPYPVILGHNKDDCFENILTNMTKCTKYENLLGMDSVSKKDNVVFLRPFLTVSKAELIEYAKKQGISYLYDSTPKWSQRGKIRDKIVPVITNWDTLCLEGFFEMAKRMTEMNNIVDYHVDILLQNLEINTYTSNPMLSPQHQPINTFTTYIFSIKQIPKSLDIWRKIFTKLSLAQPTTKSLNAFLSRLYHEQSSKNDLKAHLSKNLSIYITTRETNNVRILQVS